MLGMTSASCLCIRRVQLLYCLLCHPDNQDLTTAQKVVDAGGVSGKAEK